MSMPQPTSQGRAPILECVREGFAFVARDWRAILPVAAIAALALTPLEAWAQASAARMDPGSALLARLAAIAVQAVVMAAFLRRTLSRGVDPLALRLGADERNVVGVTFAIAFFFAIAIVVGMIIVGAALGALLAGSGIEPEALSNAPPEEALRTFMGALGNDGRIVLLALLGVMCAAFLWVSARLALALPATVAEGRMRAFSTWSWTKGNAGPIAACIALVAIGGFLISQIALLPIAQIVALLLGGPGALQTVGTPANWVISYVAVFIGVTVLHAPYAAMTAYLYRGLRPG